MIADWTALVVNALILTPLHAQGGFPSYPYCAQYSDGTSLDCSFSTLSMCYQSVTGVGGVCINNPRAARNATAGNSQFAFGSSPVPPPPAQQFNAAAGPPPPQSSQSPLPLAPPPPRPPCNPLIDGTYCATAGMNPPASIQSLSSDLSGDGNPPATLGAINFSGSGLSCVGLFRQTSC